MLSFSIGTWIVAFWTAVVSNMLDKLRVHVYIIETMIESANLSLSSDAVRGVATVNKEVQWFLQIWMHVW